jgi:hypothetical protein
MAGALPGAGAGGPPGSGLTWLGIAGVETSRKAEAEGVGRPRVPEAHEEPPGARATLAPASKGGAGGAPTLREQLSAAAASGDAPPDAPLEPTPTPSSGEASVVSLALKVRTHAGAPYDARVPGVSSPSAPPSAPPPVVWCVAPPAPASARLRCRLRAWRVRIARSGNPDAPRRRPGAFLGAAAAVAMALKLRGTRPGSAPSSAADSDGGTPRSNSVASELDGLDGPEAADEAAEAPAAVPPPPRALPPLPPLRPLVVAPAAPPQARHTCVASGARQPICARWADLNPLLLLHLFRRSARALQTPSAARWAASPPRAACARGRRAAPSGASRSSC